MAQEVTQDQPVYPMGIVSELLKVHPETIRVWERYGLIQPKRRNNKRFYSANDLKRLRFIQRLITEGLNVPAIVHFLHLYPCWQQENCPDCMHCSEKLGCGRPCWKEEGKYCQVSIDEDLCDKCQYCERATACKPDILNDKD